LPTSAAQSAVHVDQFAVLTQHVEELAKILIRHFDLQRTQMAMRADVVEPDRADRYVMSKREETKRISG